MRWFLFLGVFSSAVLLTALVPTLAVSEEAPPEAAASEEAAPPSTSTGMESVKGMVANLANGKKIYNEGKGEAPACSSCHGEQGLGDDNMGTPRLAGQGFVFLRKQLHDFAHDKRTDNTMGIMNMVAKALSEQDRLDISAYESSVVQPFQAAASDMQAVKEGGTVPIGQRHLGKSIVLIGIPDKGVPACASCHQFNGRGAAPIYPTIGGQRYVYLANQLKAWRDGSRANDMLGQMRAVAKNMSDEDIYNVSTYLTSAPPTTMGNPKVPHESTPPVAGSATH